jgi:hypothetical protein
MSLPPAKSCWEKLFDQETLELAARDFQANPCADPSQELEGRIEHWAVSLHLADSPVRDWWIFGIAREGLRLRACGPLGEENEGIGIPVALPDFRPNEVYSFTPWDPAWESKRDYETKQHKAFKRFLDEIVATVLVKSGQESAMKRRLRTHYEWIVRYHVLNQSFDEIANTEGQRREIETIKVTVSSLRRLIGLPQRGPSGRPKKVSR